LFILDDKHSHPLGSSCRNSSACPRPQHDITPYVPPLYCKAGCKVHRKSLFYSGSV
jgi:hypothetical protein